MKLKILSLCDGMSGGFMAFKKLGVEFEYHAVEIDPYPRSLSEDNFWPDITRWENDVNNITKESIEEHGPYDWVIFGSPCQSVSVSGNGEGLDGKSGLLIQCNKILKWALEFNPDAKFLIENVKMKSGFLNQFNEIIGSLPTLLNSASVSAQKRERYYWTNFKVTTPKDRKIFLESLLEEGSFSDRKKSHCLDANFFKGSNLTQYFDKSRRQIAFGWSKSTRYKDMNGKMSPTKKDGFFSYVEQRFTSDGKSNTLTSGEGCAHQSTATVVFRDEVTWRNLTVRECARLQTISDDFSFDSVSKKEAYKAIGNGWTVDIIEHILRCGIFGTDIYQELL